MAPQDTLTVLQAGRAFAAFAVVLHHASSSSAAFVEKLPFPLDALLGRGDLGVDFFFVLSGFIIYHTCRGRPRTARGASRFATRRLIRIFVPYLPISLALIAAYLALPGLSAADREWGWLASLTLLPVAEPPALNVAWTLQHELVFYLLFAAFYFSGRLALGCGLWAGAIVAVNLLGGELQRPLAFFLHPLNLEFMFGILAARAAFQSWASIRVMLGLSLAAFAAFLLAGAEKQNSVLFGLAIALALVPLVRLELAGRLRANSVLLFFGGASYALYLIHDPLIALTTRIAARVELLDHWAGAVLLGTACSAAAAALYHVVLEQPALAVIRRRLAVRPARREEIAPAEIR